MKIAFVIMSFMLYASCTENHKEYANQSRYKIKIGEELKLYYITNSCCFYCISDSSSIKSLNYKDDVIVDDGPDDCDGCDRTSAFVFLAKQIGVDTIILKSATAGDDCETQSLDRNIYFVQVVP
ncbi:MAG: hypothetical protein H6605_10625 [Flavobacteriales bacterium]|nr:hypothetical protein [Flavobacteriales bacterium]